MAAWRLLSWVGCLFLYCTGCLFLYCTRVRKGLRERLDSRSCQKPIWTSGQALGELCRSISSCPQAKTDSFCPSVNRRYSVDNLTIEISLTGTLPICHRIRLSKTFSSAAIQSKTYLRSCACAPSCHICTSTSRKCERGPLCHKISNQKYAEIFTLSRIESEPLFSAVEDSLLEWDLLHLQTSLHVRLNLTTQSLALSYETLSRMNEQTDDGKKVAGTSAKLPMRRSSKVR